MKYFSVFEKDEDILKAINDIYLKHKWYDLDCTYSKGNFYKNIDEPRIKSDIEPLFDDVIKSNSMSLEFIEDNSLNSIVFDPPFLFRNRKSLNTDKMSKRFSYFMNYEDLINMYEASIKCFCKKLKKGGILCFKCQDMSDGKFYCTHNEIINICKNTNLELKDIIIKNSKTKLQKEAKQQNCVAKTHSYWLIFKKKWR